jgi:hypothetical protein
MRGTERYRIPHSAVNTMLSCEQVAAGDEVVIPIFSEESNT